jgi:hypothetical protein
MATYMTVKHLVFCGNCQHLDYTEAGQNIEYGNTNKKPPHFCNKYKEVVKHKKYHPNLPKLPQCDQ